MTKLTVQVQTDKELDLLYRFLDLLNIRIVSKERKTTSWEETVAFYKNIEVDAKDYKFDRDEANER